MNVVDLIRLFAESLDVGVLVTDAQLDRPGPRILYANASFARMSGYAVSEVVGLTPRLLQGRGTNREGTHQMQRALRTEGRFLGCLQNYRKGGDAYLCEIDVRAIRRLDGEPEAFIAFEREVVRRRGRPTRGGAGRYRPVEAAAAEAFLSEQLAAFT